MGHNHNNISIKNDNSKESSALSTPTTATSTVRMNILIMLGLSEVDDWGDIHHLDYLTRKLMGTTALRRSR
eukprot:10425993-Ditylum_brightwellii.AAC.1